MSKEEGNVYITTLFYIFFIIISIFVLYRGYYIRSDGIFSIATITRHGRSSSGFKADFKYNYEGEKITGSTRRGPTDRSRFAVGTHHFIHFVPVSSGEKSGYLNTKIFIDTIPSWYTLGAPDEGWCRRPFESELRRMMLLGAPTRIREIENWGKRKQPSRETYTIFTWNAMQPGLISDFHSKVTVEEIPSPAYDYGDIVVFKTQDGGTGISRIVGLPGDRIAIENHLCVINGLQNRWESIQEDVTYKTIRNDDPFDVRLVSAEMLAETFPNGMAANLYRATGKVSDRVIASLPEQVVPEGFFFILGDTRTLARDSRYFGPVPAKNIKGVVINMETI